jgi:hypothetical protein
VPVSRLTTRNFTFYLQLAECLLADILLLLSFTTSLNLEYLSYNCCLQPFTLIFYLSCMAMIHYLHPDTKTIGASAHSTPFSLAHLESSGTKISNCALAI